ncbi:MAG: RNA polymerase sigma factor, partial [Gammaproteobacteria bacterium]|nr:RNA polymerase sigma factor [Gammaproteobacteria bacterium]
MKVNVGQVYTTHKDHLYNYIFRLCSDHALAQDVVQQAFVKLLADPQLDEIENIKSYLFTIARNQLYDTWKKKTEVSTDDADILSAEPAGDNELSDDLNDEQIQQAVLICINRLSEKFRELMLLRYQEDLSIREIADITEFSESDIKVSLLRARKHFDQEMTQHMYLKIAASRQQCDDMDAMLSPYAGKEIPESDLTPFTAHISKCQLCAEDAEEQKQKRKLFALIPLVAAPLSLDTSFNDALAQTTGTTGSATTAGKISLLKLAVGVGAVAIISGGLLLYSANNQPEHLNNTANPTPEQNTVLTKNNPATTPTNNSTKGSVAINATLRLTNGGPAAVANWFIYRIDASHRDGQQHTAGHRGDQLNIKLDPGQYKIVARVGESEVSRFIEVKPNSDQTIELIAGAGTLSVSTPLPDSIKLYRSQLSFQVYKSHQDLQNHKLLL